MSSKPDRVALPGSDRQPLPAAQVVGSAHPDERIEVTVLLRRPPAQQGAAPEALGARLPRERQYLSRAAFATTQGADPADVAQVESFARAHGLTVVQVSPARRSIILAGTVRDLSSAFGVELLQYEHPEGTYRGRTGPITLPAQLAPLVEGVFGLDDRPQARPRFRLADEQVLRQAAGTDTYLPPQLAQLYNFPTEVSGKGQTIGIIELGGGYRPQDLRAYFAQLGLPIPHVVAVSVDHGRNHPTTAGGTSADPEVMLDIEVAGAVAPGVQIVVYFAPNTDQGFLDAITTAIHDQHYQPAVVSISWGAPEASWTGQAIQAMNQAAQDAATLGVTICCAAGDGGSSDGLNDGRAHVDFPASSPYVLGCGGTRLPAGDLQQEVVWNDLPSHGATGGGVSDVFALPAWQAGAQVPPSVNDGQVRRGVPDISGDASPLTGYTIRVDGQTQVVGGTSAVAPLWAGLIALLNEGLGTPVGYLNPLLYQQVGTRAAFHDITAGSNPAYQARPGWDACTGWGSPDGQQLLQALRGEPPTA